MWNGALAATKLSNLGCFFQQFPDIQYTVSIEALEPLSGISVVFGDIHTLPYVLVAPVIWTKREQINFHPEKEVIQQGKLSISFALGRIRLPLHWSIMGYFLSQCKVLSSIYQARSDCVRISLIIFD